MSFATTSFHKALTTDRDDSPNAGAYKSLARRAITEVRGLSDTLLAFRECVSPAIHDDTDLIIRVSQIISTRNRSNLVWYYILDRRPFFVGHLLCGVTPLSRRIILLVSYKYNGFSKRQAYILLIGALNSSRQTNCVIPYKSKVACLLPFRSIIRNGTVMPLLPGKRIANLDIDGTALPVQVGG
jgi:hypothetical protein